MTKEEIAELIEQMPQDMDVNDFIHELVNRALAVEREACARECLKVGDISTLTRKETRVTTLCIEAILARREK